MEWIEKYKPNSLLEYYNKSLVDKVSNWLDNWVEYNGLIKNSLLLIGPSGVGKTHLANLLFKHYKFNKVIECNANEVRTYSALTRLIDSTTNTKGIYKLVESMQEKKTAIIMDEIDGLTLGDKGCMKKILELVYIKTKDKTLKKPVKSRCPVINICSSLDNSKVTQIKKHSMIVYVNYPEADELHYLAKKIFKEEKIDFLDYEMLDYIINKRKYDYRSFLFLLRELMFITKKTKKKLTKPIINQILQDSYNKRNDLDMYQATRKILKEQKLSYEFLNKTYKSYQSVVPYIMYDNFKTVLKEAKTTNLKKINGFIDYYDDMTLGNIFEHYIYDEQMWELGDFASVIFFKRSNLLAQEYDLEMHQMSYSVILNKLSKILYNHKLTKCLMDKLKLENYHLTNFGSMILESSFYEDIDKENPTIVFLKSKGINQMDIDKLVKFNLFYKEYEERYNKIYKRKLKNLLEGKPKKKKKPKKPKKPKKIKKPKKSKKNK